MRSRLRSDGTAREVAPRLVSVVHGGREEGREGGGDNVGEKDVDLLKSGG